MDFWKSCEMGSQITITICLTIIILVIIAVCSFLFWQCKRCKAKNGTDSNDGVGRNWENRNSQNNSNDNNGSSSDKNKEDKEREIRQEEEDRAKSLIKDLFEATRVKRTDKDLKEEKCDIDVTKQLVTLYEQVLQNMSSNQTSQTVDTTEIINETEKQADGSNNQITANNEGI